MSTTKTNKPKVSKQSKSDSSSPEQQPGPAVETAPAAIPKTTSPQGKQLAPETAKKLSALDAAAKVLAKSKEAMTTRKMIEAMAAKGYWTSPGGATPHATLYSALLREITTKGEAARFIKAERGKFALKK